MYHNGYSVRVIGGNEVPGGYVEIEHRTKYSLMLRNSLDSQCDAHVEIDGKHVGTWRMNTRSSINLERPVHDTGCFTAYTAGTSDAHLAGLDDSSPDLGLIKVTFTPERPRTLAAFEKPPMFHIGTPLKGSMPQSKSRRESVGTGLSGTSSQIYGQAEKIEYDYSRQVVIHLRLVSPWRDDDTPRPLTSCSTPVPPRG